MTVAVVVTAEEVAGVSEEKRWWEGHFWVVVVGITATNFKMYIYLFMVQLHVLIPLL